jgi:methylmalonyl-CoA/ethylmalonyl-CoA epimerase
MTSEELSLRLWNLAARIGKIVDSLPETPLGQHVAAQLVRSATAVPRNYDERGVADPVHTLGVALKEQRETLGWLRFISISELLPDSRLPELIQECFQTCGLLGDSIGTAEAHPTSSDDAPMVLRNLPRAKSPNPRFPFTALDHLAIVVPNTDEALKIWRDRVGLSLLYSEEVNNGAVRLTHLDLGNTHLQLVEPLVADHPLRAWLDKNGPGLHHFCFKVDDVAEAHRELPNVGLPVAQSIHQGTRGKRALFLDRSATQGVQVEVTGS